MYWSQSLGFSEHIRLSIVLRVPLKGSTSPLHCGWYGVVVSCFKESSRPTSFMRLLVNWVPWSKGSLEVCQLGKKYWRGFLQRWWWRCSLMALPLGTGWHNQPRLGCSGGLGMMRGTSHPQDPLRLAWRVCQWWACSSVALLGSGLCWRSVDKYHASGKRGSRHWTFPATWNS